MPSTNYKEYYDCPVDARDCFAYIDYGLCSCLVPQRNRKEITFSGKDCPFYKNVDKYRRDRFESALKQEQKKRRGK